MTCLKNSHYKSSVQTYNAVAQALTATPTALNIGAAITDTGISLTPSISGVTVKKSGLYRISADITITSTAAGIVNLQTFINGVARPETLRAVTVPAAGNSVIHLETVAYISACCAQSPIITIVGNTVGAAAGSVALIAVNVIKEA